MKTPADKIRLKFQDKITQKQVALNWQYDKLIRTAEAQIRDKLETKRNRKLEKYIKLQERNRDRELKNLERKEKGNKVVTYKKDIPVYNRLNKKNVLDLLQLLCKLEVADENLEVECISCPTTMLRYYMQGGHLYTRENNATAFLMDCINGQCPTCNNDMHLGTVAGKKKELEYKRKLEQRIGTVRFKELQKKHEDGLYTPVDIPPNRRLQEIKDYAIEKIKKICAEKNIQPPTKDHLLAKVLSGKLDS